MSKQTDDIKKKYGADFYSRIGKIGAMRATEVLFKRYGADYYKKLAKTRRKALPRGFRRRGKSTALVGTNRIHILLTQLLKLRTQEQQIIDQILEATQEKTK